MRPPLLSGVLFVLAVILGTVSSGCGARTLLEIQSGDAASADDGGGPDGLVDTAGPQNDGGDAASDAGRDAGGDTSTDALPDRGADTIGEFTIGGTVTGLVGGGLVLGDNGTDSLPVKANGAFTFAKPIANGSAYAVTVLVQPAYPAQTCTISGGTGTVGASNITDILVTCSNTYTIGGTLHGLSGTLVLQNDGGDDLTLFADGSFVFATPLASGASYSVTVLSEPASQTCTVKNGSGVVGTSNVTTISVRCRKPSYTIGGTVSGLTGSGLVLQDNGGDDLGIMADGTFTFAKPLVDGSAYAVTVLSQPSGQYCSVASGTGAVAGADVTSVGVTCAVATAYTIGGTVTGLATGDSVVLQDNLTDDLTVGADGTFTFATPILQGTKYSVTVLTNPSTPPESCYVTSGTGTVGAGPVTTVVVTCYSATASGCGRFASGYTGAWSTVADNPFSPSMGMSGYVPAGGTATVYLNNGSSLDVYSTGTDTYTALTGAPVAFQKYGSTAWLEGALWSVTSGDVIRYDLTTGIWTVAATGLTTANDTQTTNDDTGNLWSYSSGGSLPSLLQYDVAAGTTTYHALSSPLGSGFSEPRITFDSCSGLFYLTDYSSTPFYSYDPASGTQTKLADLPGGNQFQDGFCGDRSGHVFAVTNTSKMYQFTISTGVWAAMPSGGPTGMYNSACGVGADGYLYATDPASSTTMYRIQLN